jgi:hypothetical protein
MQSGQHRARSKQRKGRKTKQPHSPIVAPRRAPRKANHDSRYNFGGEQASARNVFHADDSNSWPI